MANPTCVSPDVIFFIAASHSSRVLGGLSASSPAFLKRSTFMYICWKFPCSSGVPYRTFFHFPIGTMYFGIDSSQILTRSAGIGSQKSYCPHHWWVIPLKKSGAPLLPMSAARYLAS